MKLGKDTDILVLAVHPVLLSLKNIVLLVLVEEYLPWMCKGLRDQALTKL